MLHSLARPLHFPAVLPDAGVYCEPAVVVFEVDVVCVGIRGWFRSRVICPAVIVDLALCAGKIEVAGALTAAVYARFIYSQIGFIDNFADTVLEILGRGAVEVVPRESRFHMPAAVFIELHIDAHRINVVVCVFFIHGDFERFGTQVVLVVVVEPVFVDRDLLRLENVLDVGVLCRAVFISGQIDIAVTESAQNRIIGSYELRVRISCVDLRIAAGLSAVVLLYPVGIEIAQNVGDRQIIDRIRIAAGAARILLSVVGAVIYSIQDISARDRNDIFRVSGNR